MVLVIDFGSQYTELLVRQVRQNCIFADIKEWNDPQLLEEATKYQALILSGSPGCARDSIHDELFRGLIALGKPMLCVCYGMQVMHKILGGEVVYGHHSEFGATEVTIVKYHYLVDGIPTRFNTWMSHNDSVIQLAPNFDSIAQTSTCQAIAADDKRRIYTIQFHPEVEHANYGERLITNFLLLICKLKQNWQIQNITDEKVRTIKERIKREKVYLAISGGVDSAVVAKLLKASKVDVEYIFVDTGLMWSPKMEQIVEWMKEEFENRLIIVDAREKFLAGLKGVIDPEEKRHTIGRMFMEVFSDELQKRGNSKFLAQGTIKSDLIESGKQRQANKIKTHHNTICDLKDQFHIIEPISDLFKDEVRKLAKTLNIPDIIVNAHPFPGPGYAIRILGEVTEEKLRIIKRADSILTEELEKRGIYQSISQCFCVLVGGRSVGVAGDQRNYGYILAIRAINSRSMMTAKAALIPINLLIEIGIAITNRIKEVTRVVYDLTSKPPATIEWE